MKSLKSQLLSIAGNTTVEKLDMSGLPDYMPEGLHIKLISAKERETLEDAMQDETIKHKVRATSFVHTVCNDAGELLFTPEDIDAVNELPIIIVDRAFTQSNKLNGFNTPSAVDDAEKNS